MSVSEDFERVRELRKRAADYERAAADPTVPTSVRTRYVLIANHYRVVADGEERAERARWRAKAISRQLVKYRRTTRLRLNKCLGDDLAPPLPAAIVATPICRYPKILIRGSLSPR